MKLGKALLLCAMAVASVSAFAQQSNVANTGLQKGNIETAFTAEWFKVKEVSGSTATVTASGGYLITDNLEAGAALSYTRTPDSTGGNVGVFAHWNFLPHQQLTPFAGIRLVPTYFGDEKDFYKNSWEVTGGAKIYPYDHVGMSIAAFYGRSNLDAATPGFGDTSTQYGLRAGFLIKF